MMSSETNRKYEFASQSALLFAYLVDQFESGRLREIVSAWLSSAVGARTALAYDAEVTLLSNLLYLVPSVLGSGRTPGHSFCDFLLVKLPPPNIRDGNQGNQLTTSRETAVRPLTISERLLLPTMLAVVPYILSRRYSISKGVLDLYRILTSSEQEEQRSSAAVQGDDADNDVIDDEAHTSSSRAGSSVYSESSWRTSILGVLYTSMVSTVAALGSDYKVIADGLTGFLQDVHRYLFLLDGRFYEFALRLMRVRLVTSLSTRSKISLRPLSWLVAFRISLLVYYFCRVLLSEIDKQQRAAAETEDSRASAVQLRDSGAAAEITAGELVSQSPHKCSLCLDRLMHPAAIPCGHVFCWTCIVSYVHSSSSDRAASAAIATVLIRCPICRFEFTGQKVRALYSYS